MMILYIDFYTGIFVSSLFLDSMVSSIFIRSESTGILREANRDDHSTAAIN